MSSSFHKISLNACCSFLLALTAYCPWALQQLQAQQFQTQPSAKPIVQKSTERSIQGLSQGRSLLETDRSVKSLFGRAAENNFVQEFGVDLNIRRLLAYEPRVGRSRATARVEPAQHDLTSKLSQLHFKSFKLVADETRNLAFDRTASLELGDGHAISIKPSYRAKNKVCLWLRWVDAKGLEILNTKLHLLSGEAVVTGTEEGRDTGTVLAISAVPAKMPVNVSETAP